MKTKKIVFNEKIDKSIRGLALVITFIVIGCFLQFDNNYFGTGTNIIKWIFIVVGALGLMVELKKYKSNLSVEGFQNISVGVLLLIIINFVNPKINLISSEGGLGILRIALNTISFFFLLISLYGLSCGIIELCYSLYLIYKKGIKKFIVTIFTIITSVFSLILIILQILDVLNMI